MENNYPPCIGCGYCCKKVQCPLSYMMYGPCNICPALHQVGEVYRCGLANKYHEVLAIDTGCCSNLNSDRATMIKKGKAWKK